MKQRNYYGDVIHLLQQLKKDFPSYTIAQHLSIALDDYGNFWGLTDREFLSALEKYATELEYASDEPDIDNIIKDGRDLFSIEEEEDGS